MFVGHAGLALLARARRTGPSFWVLLAAAWGPSLGISLYAHPGLDLLVEVGIAIAAWAVYAQRHRPTRGVLLGVPTLLVALQVAFANEGRLGGSWKHELLQGVVARVRARLDSASG
jgi:hypothetical protein